MSVWRIVSRVATVAGIVGGLLFLLLFVVSLIAFVPGDARGGGSQSIHHEPISFEEASQLIDTGQVYLVAIRREGNIDEYFLLQEVAPDHFEEPDPSRRWNVDGIDVHVFTESMDTGVPILSDNADEVGITKEQLDEIRQRVDQFNVESSWKIEVLDQRDQ
jgi:hypothetical protein